MIVRIGRHPSIDNDRQRLTAGAFLIMVRAAPSGEWISKPEPDHEGQEFLEVG